MTCNQARGLMLLNQTSEESRLHVNGCESCRQFADQIRLIADSLSTTTPLNESQKALWMAATRDDSPSLSLPSRRVPWRIAAVLLVGMGLALASWRFLGPRPHRPEVHRTEPNLATRAFRADAGQKLTALDAQLDAMERELAELERQADLLQERREAEALWADLKAKTDSRVTL
jgi:hypothetical protein